MGWRHRAALQPPTARAGPAGGGYELLHLEAHKDVASQFYDGPMTGEYDVPTQKALRGLIDNKNFEECLDEARGRISSQVIDILREKFGRKNGLTVGQSSQFASIPSGS